MYMFARFDENTAMTLQDIKETKRYGRTDGQRENSIPTTNKVCGGIIMSTNHQAGQRMAQSQDFFQKAHIHFSKQNYL